MKVVTDNAIYIQKNDIKFIIQNKLDIPTSIFLKIFEKEIIGINNNNKYEFIKFEEENSIKYFKDVDWIIDYDEIKKLSEEQIIELINSISDRMNEMDKKYNQMSNEEKEINEDLIIKYKLLRFNVLFLGDFLLIKQGYLDIALPDSVEQPYEFSKTKEKGIKKILKTMFNINKKHT